MSTRSEDLKDIFHGQTTSASTEVLPQQTRAVADILPQETPAAAEVPPQREQSERVHPTDTEDYGYNFFPKRLERKPKNVIRDMYDKSWDNRDYGKKIKCQANVAWCINNNPFVKLLMRALKSKGCEVDLRRHITCEPCKHGVNGGYDAQTSQVVVCYNNTTNSGTCCSVLGHEFIHAFDYCRAKADFTDMKHLACTEIRAANAMHCSYMAACETGEATFFNIKGRHQECVKMKAAQSVMTVRNVSKEEALKVVESVFTKCYNDLEPFGRIPRKYTIDKTRAMHEGLDYGYIP